MAQLALLVSACQSARHEPSSETELRSRELPSNVEHVSDEVQSSFLQIRERAAAGELSAADRAQLNSSFSDHLRPAEPAPAAPKASAAPAKARAATAGSTRALANADAARFGRLRAAIERANAAVERRGLRSAQTDSGSKPRP
ncbi:MAG: hypothetical protein ABI895_43490 [Deltaproteobacteria bacterium]